MYLLPNQIYSQEYRIDQSQVYRKNHQRQKLPNLASVHPNIGLSNDRYSHFHLKDMKQNQNEPYMVFFLLLVLMPLI